MIMVVRLIKKLKSLRPAGARKAGCRLNFFSLRNSYKYMKLPPGRRGHLVNFFSLRNTCKYMKLLKKIVTPPPPPHCVIAGSKQPNTSPANTVIPVKTGIPSHFSTKLRLGKSWYGREKICLIRDGRPWAGALIGKLFSPISHYFQNTAISLCALKAKLLAFSSVHTVIPVKTGISSWLGKVSRSIAESRVDGNTLCVPVRTGISSLWDKKLLKISFLKLSLLFIFFFSMGCEKKPSACEKKLKGFKTCLLSQFYSVSCSVLTEKKSVALKELCKKNNLNSDLEKKCSQKIKNLKKTILKKKFNKCKKKLEAKKQ